jgi:hypothetical protein
MTQIFTDNDSSNCLFLFFSLSLEFDFLELHSTSIIDGLSRIGLNKLGYQIRTRTETPEETLEIEKFLVRKHREIKGDLSLPLNIYPK